MALRFNPPPGWPAPPEGWDPPEGWQPDPAWPAAPQGWLFWVPEEVVSRSEEPATADPVIWAGDAAPPTQSTAGDASQPTRSTAAQATPKVYWSSPNPPAAWASPQPGPTAPDSAASPAQSAQPLEAQLGGPAQPPTNRTGRSPGTAAVPDQLFAGITKILGQTGFRTSQWIALSAALAVALGSVLPFVSYQEAGFLLTWQVRPAVLVLSFLFGMLLGLLVVLTRRSRLRPTAGLTLLGLSLLGFFGYLLFTVIGLTSGMETSAGPFGTRTVHWSPNIGIVLCMVGTAVTAFQSVPLLREPTERELG
ncbi:hypothetical protein [Kineosporia babensis]|uniref:Uncharacterized protein n=1 Tax=Kineosporia babensis TaxID=499548 RepID=A0A9X1N9K2_9ACTN|nr:hypothetical protein [Kineosporia babensis]MCD5310058.1 hypothetical protein [Kineosporia babensis]